VTIWDHLQTLDRQLMRLSFRGRSPALDRSLVALTRAANYSRLWLLVAGVLTVSGGRRGRRAAGRGLIAIAFATAVANGPAKLLVRRRRPSSSSRPTLIRTPRSTSFPSGHSAAAFAFATGACAELPELAPVLFPLAGVVAYSRVHTGVHYPSDAAAGAAIGVSSGVLSTRLLSAHRLFQLTQLRTSSAPGCRPTLIVIRRQPPAGRSSQIAQVLRLARAAMRGGWQRR
jgi:membrane-associated phospholipid phosphatase